MKAHRKTLLITVGMVALAYIAVANAVFSLRHPWATPTEQSLWVGSALRFEYVPYDVMRPRVMRPLEGRQ